MVLFGNELKINQFFKTVACKSMIIFKHYFFKFHQNIIVHVRFTNLLLIYRYLRQHHVTITNKKSNISKALSR
jgi:hypothetical protein